MDLPAALGTRTAPDGGLARAGVEAGTRVAVVAPNSPEWIMTALALLQLGAVAVPVDAQMTEEGLAHVLRDSQAGWIFATRGLATHLARWDFAQRSRVSLLDDREGDRVMLPLHLHSLVLDGMYTRTAPDAAPVFHPVPRQNPAGGEVIDSSALN